jgi:hypothetical protein
MDHDHEVLTEAQNDHDGAWELYLLFIIQADAWRSPKHGAVSPAVSTFLEATPPGESGFVTWARWLMLPHESDEGVCYISPELALTLVDALGVGTDRERAEMRRVIRETPPRPEGTPEYRKAPR